MPTATGKETAEEKRARESGENRAAKLRAIEDLGLREQAAIDAQAVKDGGPLPKYPSVRRLALTAGKRRTYEVAEGQLRAIALTDALEAVGIPCVGTASHYGATVYHTAQPEDFSIERRS